MEFNDSGNPEIYLLMDDAAVTSSGIKRYYPLSNEIENYNNIYYERDIGTTLNSLELLLKKRKGSINHERGLHCGLGVCRFFVIIFVILVQKENIMIILHSI